MSANKVVGVYEAVLFDLDGTLVDSLGSFELAAKRVFQKHSIELPKTASLKELVKKPFGYVVRTVIPQIDDSTVERLVQEYISEYNADAYRTVRPNDGSLNVLKSLKERGKKIAIVTARTVLQDSLWPTLSYLGLDRYVDTLVTPRNVIAPKPAPYEHVLALQNLNVEPQKALSVGDSPEDIRASKAAGVKSVGYTGGFFPKERLAEESPEYIIEDLADVLELV
ncbi:MAG: HAD-IA family hydrolase [Thermoprotei archaeon]